MKRHRARRRIETRNHNIRKVESRTDILGEHIRLETLDAAVGVLLLEKALPVKDDEVVDVRNLLARNAVVIVTEIGKSCICKVYPKQSAKRVTRGSGNE